MSTHPDAIAEASGTLFSQTKRPVTTMVTTSFLSSISNNMTAIAVPWFVLTLTGSAAQTGLTAAVTLLPSVVMSFFGGAIADRVNAKRLSIFSDVMSGATVALVPLLYLLDVLTFPLLLLLMFLGAVFDTPGHTARSTMLPRLAERASVPLERINSAFGVSQSVSAIIGAVASGLLIGILGATNVLWFNAAAFTISALAMTLFVPDLGVNPPSGSSLMGDVKAGFHYVRENSLIRTIILAGVVVNAMYSPIFGVIMPYYAKTVFNSATALGIIAASYGAGTLVGSLSYGFIGERVPKRTQVIASATLLSLPISGLIAIPSFGWTIAIIAVCAIGSGLINPLLVTIVMKETPQHMLGRVMGVISAGMMVAAPLGMIAVGPVLDAIGLRGTFIAIAVILSGVFLMIVTSRTIRHMDDARVSTVEAA
jgi:MFS family permease